ncbi:MAG: tellurite resistance TerB family protein [Pseudomonadota bacterium]
MTDLLGGVLGNSGGLLEHLQGDQSRQAGLADLLSSLGATQSKPDGNIIDQVGGLFREKAGDAPDDFLNLLDQVNGKTGGMEKTTGMGAVVTLALNMLMGRDASGFANKAVKMGGVGALGSVAMQAFQNWQSGAPEAQSAISPAVHELADSDAESRAEALLCAMVAAAKADEHIDAEEEARLERAFKQSGMDASAQEFFLRELRAPLDAGRIAGMADDLETAAEIYAATLLVVDDMNAAERVYLGDLRDKLGMPSALAETIESNLKA